MLPSQSASRFPRASRTPWSVSILLPLSASNHNFFSTAVELVMNIPLQFIPLLSFVFVNTAGFEKCTFRVGLCNFRLVFYSGHVITLYNVLIFQELKFQEENSAW